MRAVTDSGLLLTTDVVWVKIQHRSEAARKMKHELIGRAQRARALGGGGGGGWSVEEEAARVAMEKELVTKAVEQATRSIRYS